MEDGSGSTPLESEPEYCLLNDHKVKKYPIKTSEIPSLDFYDPKAGEYISAQEPVVLKGSDVIETALKWDLEYLTENIGDGENAVYLSKNGKFMYFDEKRRINQYASFKFPTEKQFLSFSNFHQLVKSWKPGDKKLYLQQMLTNTVKEKVVADFLGFNWKWLSGQQQRNNWGPLTSNLLLVAQPGNITPVHFDEQENFFAQAKGYKRCILFSPSQFQCLYPFPYHHPCDRQSQVDFDCPDYDKFPLFKKAFGREVIVGPGDILYIPVYWWHYIESVMEEEETISINFWYKAATSSSKEITFPLKMDQKVAIMRNIEKLVGEALGDPREVGDLLNTIVRGRYPEDNDSLERFYE